MSSKSHIPRLSQWAGVFFCAFAVCAVVPQLPAQAAEQPHIVLILADDLGPGDLSCYGGDIAKTPHIDKLASEGTRFTQFYVAAPICSPSRCGLLTGQFPARWRITSFLQTRKGNRGCEQDDFLDPQAPSLPRILRSAGYKTAHIGKWHLGGGRDVQNAPKFAEYGYDEGIGTYESPEPHPDITATDWIWSPQDKVKRWERTGFFVDKTLDFLSRHKDQHPCFVNLWLDDSHTPWIPSADAEKGDNLKNLRGVLRETDRQIGRLMEGLKQLGLDDKTLVIFMSDNGALPTFMGRRNLGMRGSKLSLYEGGIRMPCIVRWPGAAPAGRTDNESVLAAVDLLPTLVDIAGAKLPEGVAFDGQNVRSALTGQAISERKSPLFWEYGRNDEFFKYPGKVVDRSPRLAVREGNWKLLLNHDGSGAELYDLAVDRNETNNLAQQKPEVVKSLSEKLLAWQRTLPKPAAAAQTSVEPATKASANPNRPNLVIFLADDLSLADCSPYGAKEVRTPNMQRLAEAGLTFTHAFVASPTCAPSRAAMLTGLMPARNGAEANHSRARDEIKKLPEYLEELGYEVAAFGKVSHYNHGKHYKFKNTQFEAYHDHRGIPAAIDFLRERDASKPLCLFVGTNWPHVPWPKETGDYDPATLTITTKNVDTPVSRMFLARYYQAVTTADEDLGKVYDAVQKHLSKNTLFLFSSDHGAQWPFHKWNCYDAGVRVPLIAVWPDKIQPGSKTDAMVSWIDFLPTLVDAAGGQPPRSGLKAGEIDGQSFAPVLRGEKKDHRERIFTTHSSDGQMNIYPIRSLHTRRWHLILNLHPEFKHTTHVDRAKQPDGLSYFRSWEQAAREGNAKAAELVQRYHQRPEVELYDLENDPLELRNLAAEPEHAERVKEMRAQLEAWMREQGDQKTVFGKPILLEEMAAQP